MLIIVYLLFLTPLSLAQSGFRYFSLNSTFSVSSASEINQGQIAFKFHMVDESVLLASISVVSETYLIYYYARAAQVCVCSSQGSVMLNIHYGLIYDLELKTDQFFVKGNEVQFDVTKLHCPRSHNLTASAFLHQAAELRLEPSLAIQFASDIDGYFELPSQSCQSQDPNSTSPSCSQCVEGYGLFSQNCELLPYGCLRGDSSGCLECRDHFTYDDVNHLCYGGTQALPSSNDYITDANFLAMLGNQEWAVQFYFMALPLDDQQTSQYFKIVKAVQTLNYITIRAEYTYQFTSSSVNRFRVSLKANIGGAFPSSSWIEFPLGEWVAIGLYFTPPNQYTLAVQKYGQTTLSTDHIAPSLITLSLMNVPLQLYYKELLLWGDEILTVLLSTDHNCRLIHPTGFTPKAQFNLDVDSNTLTTQLLDTQLNSPPAVPLLNTGLTLSNIIEDFQPVAGLDYHYFESLHPTTPLCLLCAPFCALCSGLFQCSLCASGVLVNGLCIGQVVSPVSGDANSTLFQFDSYDFQSINEHALRQLQYDQSSEILAFHSLLLEYPNATRVQVPHVNSFLVPRFQQTGVTNFNVSVSLKYSIEGVLHTSLFTTLSLTQEEHSEAHQVTDQITQMKLNATDNPCGCSQFGECNPQDSSCDCDSGYAGTYCQFTTSDLAILQAQVLEAVTHLSQNTTLKSDQAILTQLSLLSEEEDTLTSQTSMLVLNITQHLLSNALSSLVLGILSNLSEKARSDRELGLTLGIKSNIGLMFQQANDTGLNLTSPKINLQVLPLASSSSQQIKPSLLSNTSVTLPPGLVPGPLSPDSYWLVTVLYQEPIYSSISPSGHSSEVFSIQLY